MAARIPRTQADDSRKGLPVKVLDIPQRPPPTAPAGCSMTVLPPLPEQELWSGNAVREKDQLGSRSDIDQERFPSASRVRNPNPSRGSSLMFIPNGSLETMGNLSAPSLYTRAEVGSIDIDYRPTVQMELPAADTLSTTPLSPLLAQDRELLFGLSFPNCFKCFEYEREAESWMPVP